MEIHRGAFDEYNVADKNKPLLEAILRGDRIKSVTCMCGTMNENNPELDFQIKGFTVTDYWVGMGWNERGWVDLVDLENWDYCPEDLIHVDNKGNSYSSFYMNWVRSFELYD